MTERLFLDGKNFITVADAIVRSGYVHNHITRLCREGKLEGKKVGATWYVGEDSLEEFLTRPETLVEDGKRYILAAEAAKTVGYARDYVLELCREKRIDAKKVDDSWMVEENAIKHFFLEQQRVRLVRDSVLAKERREARVQSASDQTRSTLRSSAVIAVAPKALSHYLPHRKSNPHVKSAAVLAVVMCMLVGGYQITDAYRSGTLAMPTFPVADELLASAASTETRVADAVTPLWSFFGSLFSRTLLSAQDLAGAYFGTSTMTHQQGAVSVKITASPTVVAPNSPSLTNTSFGVPITQTVINQPVIERIRESVKTISTGGITPELLAAALEQLDNKLSSQIANVTASGNATYQVVAQTNRIDQLSGTDLTNVTVHGVSGLTASDIPTLSYFADTSIISIAYGGTGTSTLPTYGKMLLGNSLGGYDLVATSSLGISTSQWVTAGSDISYNTGNVGIGTTTPTYKLSVEGSSSLGNQAIAGYFTATSTTASSTFPNLLSTNATTTNSTSTNQYSSSLVAGNATSTNLFSTTASSTNLFTSNFSLGTLSGFLKATAGAVTNALINLTTDITGILAVANGGTGWAAIQSGTIPYGNGASALATSSAFTFDGTKLIATYASSTSFTASGSVYLATSGGNVGIGTAAPLAVLSVGTQGTFTNNASTTIFTNSVGLGTGVDAFGWVSEFRNNSGGNTDRLLIGEHRTVAGSNWTSAAWRIQPAVDNSFTGMSSNRGYLEFSHGSSGSYSGVGLSGSGALAPDVVINTSGNVGIGQTSPGFPLNFASTVGDKISLYGNSGAHWGFGIQSNLMQIHADTANGDIAFGYGTSAAFTETMRIEGTGNVGIGTTTPWAQLSINPTTANGTAPSFVIGSSTATKFIVDNAGNVGIGTTNPGIADLKINNDASLVGLFIGTTTPYGQAQFEIDSIPSTHIWISENSTRVFNVGSGGAGYFAGNVGIGTTTPFTKLEVSDEIISGAIKTTGGNLRMISGNYGSFLRNDGSSTYLLLTASGDQYGTWNTLRPFSVNDSTGAVSINTAGSGATTIGNASSVLTINSTTLTYSSATKNVIPNNTASAWTIATSSTATPLVQIDTTTGSELVTIGKRGGSVQIGDSTTPTNLVFGGSSTISGSGLYTLTFGTTGDVIQYGVGIKPSTTNVFNLGASGSNWGCLYYNNSTLGTCASDERLKTGITDLSFDTATSSALDQLTGLRLRSFAYKSAPTSIYDGLIAQEVQAVAPELVVEDASTTMLAVKYGDIQWLTIAALQQLNAKFNALLGSASSTDQTVDTPPFFSRLLQWFASATNGVGDFFASRVHTKELCVTKTDGTDVCVSGDQLAAVLAGQSASAPVSASAGAAVSAGSASPVITVLGLNPAHIAVGSSYSDLGATVTDDKDINLGIYISVDGGATTTQGLVSVDTTVAGTHTILYRATDNDGNTTTATRQVIVGTNNSGEGASGTTTPSGSISSGASATTTPAVSTSTPIVDTATSTDSTSSNTSGQTVAPQVATSTTP